ncbi:n-acetyltransferase 9-like protein [Ramicandelaber brevisporus]|nr:n-acetyltransferase 9-like protein [Ramicandelaber brevisporus]
MKANENVLVIGSRLVLCPYEKEHVPRYHEWMQDEDLLEASGSEPLSLEEEFAMQQTWRTDEDKCTFIVHSQPHGVDCSKTDGFSPSEVEQLLDVKNMIGDINLFISEMDNEDASNVKEKRMQAEINVMIAERDYRGRGLGKEAVTLMMEYAVRHLDIHHFFVCINDDNVDSIRMFTKMGFTQTGHSEVFKQTTLTLDAPQPRDNVIINVIEFK